MQRVGRNKKKCVKRVSKNKAAHSNEREEATLIQKSTKEIADVAANERFIEIEYYGVHGVWISYSLWLFAAARSPHLSLRRSLRRNSRTLCKIIRGDSVAKARPFGP